MQVAMGVAQSGERFDTGDLSGSGVDEGLEDGDRLTVEHRAHP